VLHSGSSLGLGLALDLLEAVDEVVQLSLRLRAPVLLLATALPRVELQLLIRLAVDYLEVVHYLRLILLYRPLR
jgi:hypothetical protein